MECLAKTVKLAIYRGDVKTPVRRKDGRRSDWSRQSLAPEKTSRGIDGIEIAVVRAEVNDVVTVYGRSGVNGAARLVPPFEFAMANAIKTMIRASEDDLAG